MTKKITPDSPSIRNASSMADRDMYLRKVSDEPSNESEPAPANTTRLLDTLAFTCSGFAFVGPAIDQNEKSPPKAGFQHFRISPSEINACSI